MQNSHIFSQVINKINWEAFSRLVERHNGDFAAKGITCKSQFIMMLFSHIAGADSLREICQGMAMQGGNLNHMGIEKVPGKSSLAYANEKRPWQIYKDMFEHMVTEFQPKISGSSKPGKFKGKLFSVDSTTIDLCLSLFPWAKFRKRKGAVKIHTVLDHDGLMPVFADVTNGKVHDVKAFRNMFNDGARFPKDCVIAMDRAYVDYELFGYLTNTDRWFVTRLKSNSVFKIIEKRIAPAGKNILKDEIIELTSSKGERCGYYLRRIVVWDEKKSREIELVCNNLKFGASTIAGFYKERWQIELFFKQIKQNLNIKSFVGTSENAVKTQIYSSLCAILLLRYLKSISDSKRELCKEKSFSFSNMVMMLRISLFRRLHLDQWLLNPFVPPPETSDSIQQNMILFGQHGLAGGG